MKLLNSMVDENMALGSLSNDEAKDYTSSNTILNQDIPLDLENNIDTNNVESKEEVSNGLENFELNDHSPQLFNNDSIIENDTKEENTNLVSEENELEIPAFLRRQKINCFRKNK